MMLWHLLLIMLETNMEKIAVISDIHGNYRALKTVLSDIKKRGIENIYCLGDVIGKGSRPNECLDLLKDAVMVYGNWEDFFNNKICSSDFALERHKLLDEKLSLENKIRLRNLPLCYELYISGRLVRMFHANPHNAWDSILSIDRLDKLYEQFLPTKNTSDKTADVVVYAHTHAQALLRLYNRVLINVGSVGNAFDIIRNRKKDGDVKNTTTANYLIIEGVINSKKHADIRFEFVSLDYDINLELEESKDNPELDNYAKELLTGEFRNVGKYQNNFASSYYDINHL